MSSQIQNSTKALWAIFCLLPIQKQILLFAKRNINQHICIHKYIKAGKYLKKGFSILDIKSLLYVMNVLFRGREVGGVSTVILAPCRIKTSAAASMLNQSFQKYTHKKNGIFRKKTSSVFFRTKT